MNENNQEVLESIFNELNNEIDRETDEKLVAQSKLSIPINREKIREETMANFLNDLKKLIEKESQLIDKFYAQLKHDDPKLFDSIYDVTQKRETLAKNIKSFDEIKNHDQFTYHPEDIEKCKQLGQKWFDLKDWEKAHSYFCFITQDNPNDFIARVMRGMIEQNKKSYEEAIKSYSIAIPLEPANFVPYILMMKCLISKKDFETARKCFEDFLKFFKISELEKNEYVKNNLITIQENLKAA